MKTYHYYLIALIGLASCDFGDNDQDRRDSVSIEDLFAGNTSGGQATTNGNWEIQLLVEEGFDLTKNYSEVRLAFSDQGLLQASGVGEPIAGRWLIERENDGQEISFDFPVTSALAELGDDWDLIEQTESLIVLEEREDGRTNRLVLAKNGQQGGFQPPYTGSALPAEQVYAQLDQGSYAIAKIIDDRLDRTALLANASLTFHPLGRLELQTPGGNVQVGNWRVGFNDEQVMLSLDLSDQGVSDLVDEDWLLGVFSATSIHLSEYPNGQGDFLKLVKK